MSAEIRGIGTQGKFLNAAKYGTFLNPDIIKGAILVPNGFSYAVSDNDADEVTLASLLTALTALMKTDSQTARGQHIGPFEQMDDKSEDPQVQTLGYGKVVDTNRGIYNWDFTFDEGGLQYFLSVLSYRGKVGEYKVIFYDAKGNIYAAKNKNATGKVIGFKGLKMSRFYPKDWKLANKQTEAAYMVSISLANSAEWNEELYVYQTGTDIQSFIEPYYVQDITLLPATATGTGVFPVTVRTAMGKVNVADSLPALADPDYWVATRVDTGASITISSIAIVNGRFVFTFSTSSPYLATKKIALKTAAVSVLEADDLKYYESDTAIIVMN